jgi:hypothetical protein
MNDSQAERPSEIQQLSRETAPPLATMTRPPDDPKLREAMGNSLWVGIFNRFTGTLSDSDKALWALPPQDPSQSPAHLRLLNRFDDFVVEQFHDYGWRLLMSHGALCRIAEWTKNSPERLEAMSQQLALHSRILRGESVAPFPPDIEEFAAKAIPELGLLLRRQREEFGSRPVEATCSKIAGWMKWEIQASPDIYPTLSVELPQLLGWVETLPRRNKDAAKTLTAGDMRAPGFFYQWYSACTNRSLKDVQNKFSELRRRRRSASPSAKLQKNF